MPSSSVGTSGSSTKREANGAAWTNSDGKTFIYLVGGYENKVVLEYDIEADTYTTKTSASNNHYRFAMTATSTHMYVFSGHRGPRSDWDTYSFADNAWTNAALSTTGMTATADSAAVALDGVVYVIGMGGTGTHKFDGSTWSSLAAMPSMTGITAALVPF